MRIVGVLGGSHDNKTNITKQTRTHYANKDYSWQRSSQRPCNSKIAHNHKQGACQASATVSPEEKMMTDEDFEYLWKKRDEVLYKAELSCLYHRKRERFFDACDKLTKVSAIIGGSAALLKSVSADGLQYIALAITITSALSLVFGLPEKARRHSELAGKFKTLESEILAIGDRDFTELDVTRWRAAAAQLEAGEPQSLSALTRICQNELAYATGHQSHMTKLSLREKLLAQFLDMPRVSPT